MYQSCYAIEEEEKSTTAGYVKNVYGDSMREFTKM
jgi:hypothetical protein